MSTKKRGRKPQKDPYFGQVEESAVKEFLSLGRLVEDPYSLEGFRWTGSTKEEFRRNAKILEDTLKSGVNRARIPCLSCDPCKRVLALSAHIE